MKASHRALSGLLLIALALAGCGNKGDLVQPPPEAPAKDAPAEP
jgi:predicted small lipoprotein YifL